MESLANLRAALAGRDVTTADMPNIFIEAVTVHGGKQHVVTREFFVPPASRVLNVEVAPSAEAFLPGQAAKFLLKLTDENGAPYVGSLALSIYDKAVEYIAGGTNVADIREFFWKWRRNHQPRGETNLDRHSPTLVDNDKPSMQNLGLFGGDVASEVQISNGLGGGRMMKSHSSRAAPMAMSAVPLRLNTVSQSGVHSACRESVKSLTVTSLPRSAHEHPAQ